MEFDNHVAFFFLSIFHTKPNKMDMAYAVRSLISITGLSLSTR